LVDDPGDGNTPHTEDVVRRVREVLDLLWGDHAGAVESEARRLLGLPASQDLRAYFRNARG
jgi:hypothetical protein